MIEKGVPISPSQVAEKKRQIMPEVIDIFSDLIARNFSNGSATVKAKDATAKICEVLGVTRDVVYSNHYLDVEEVFREVGWKVKYEQPDYTENFDSYFEFRK